MRNSSPPSTRASHRDTLIESISVDVLNVPVSNPYLAAGRKIDANWHVLARVRTRGGAQGFGYVVKPGASLIGAIAVASRELGRVLIGADVLAPEAAWHQLANAGKGMGPGGLLHWAIAPLDIALWDAAGHALGQPLHRMLGGYRNHVRAYASDNLWYSLSREELARSAAAHAQAGFTACKLRLGNELKPSEQVARVEVAQAAAGTNVNIMVDATESWQPSYAKSAGQALADVGVSWLEDPVHHANVDALTELRTALDLSVTGGENLYTLAQFRHSLDQRAFDVAILDLFRVGGITPWRDIAALAKAHSVPISGHVVPEVHAHLLAAVPHGHAVEYMPRSQGILDDHPVPTEGVLSLTDRPGHGLRLDNTSVNRYREA